MRQRTSALSIVAAEVLGPDRGSFVPFELADPQADADFAVGAEDIFVVLGRLRARR